MEGGTTDSLITAYFNADINIKQFSAFFLYGPWRRIVNEAAEVKAEEAWITSVCPEKGGKFPSCLPSDPGESTEWLPRICSRYLPIK